VRKLVLADDIQSRVNRRRFVVDHTVIEAWFASDGLFPQLRGLRVVHHFIQRTSILLHSDLFMRGCLTDLSLVIDLENAVISSCEISDVCTGLDRLTLKASGPRGHQNKHRWADWISGLLSCTTRLRAFETTFPLRYRDVVRLSEICTLRRLQFTRFSDLPTRSSLPAGGFRSLRELTMYLAESNTTPVEDALAMLTFSPNDCFHSFELTIRPIVEMETVCMKHDQLSEIVRRLCKHPRLRDVSISASQANYAESSLEWSTALYRSFNMLNELETLCIYVGLEIRIDRTIIFDLVRACPRLRIWQIYHLGMIKDCFISFDDFLQILLCCPDLKRLPEAVHVDMSISPSEDLQGNFGTHVYGPFLGVRDIEVKPEVINTLSSLLPHVRRLRGPLSQRIGAVRDL
jgi:hypothetical protein